MSIEKPIAEHESNAKFSLFLIVSVGCFLLLISILIFAGHKSASAFADANKLIVQNAKVEVTRIKIQEAYLKPRTVFGQLEPTQQAKLGFELSGLLSQVFVTEGDYVRRGDNLAILDMARLKASENELLSSVNRAQAEATLAQLSMQRTKNLVKNKLESQQQLDEATASLDAAEAALKEAKARLQTLQVEIEKSTLHAPFSGQIVQQFVDTGTVLSSGQAVFTIIADEALEARFGLPEQTAFALTLGQVLRIDVSGHSLQAKVSSIAKQRGQSTRTIDTVLSIDKSQIKKLSNNIVDNTIVSGDLVSLSIELPQQKQGAWVPMSSLASGIRGLWALYIVDQNNQIQTRLVSVEYADADKAYVSGAISDNERLVISGIHRLVPQQKALNVLEVENVLAFNISTQFSE